MRDERTLTERLERVENILSLSGFGGDEYSGCDGTVTGQRHVNEFLSDRAVGRNTEQTKAPEPTSFEEIASRIQTGTDRICMIASKLEEIGNRVFGTLPEEAAGLGGAERKPDGMLDHTFIALNWLDQALCRLHTAAARLERV